MKRHLNYTGRARITRDEAPVRILEEQIGGSDVFDLRLRLGQQRDFPPDSRIRVEAGRSNASQRWDFGTVGNPLLPSPHERRLTDVDSTTFFRVFVVEPGTGKLLGLADKIRPVRPLDSLIPLLEDSGTKLGTEVWRVDFDLDQSDGPVLLVNNAVPTIGDIVRNDARFRALVMPQVLRQVLSQMLYVEKMDPDDDEGGWGTEWFEFVSNLGVKPDIDMTWGENLNRDAAQDYIDQAVMAFAAQKVRPVSSYGDALGGGR